MTPASPPRWQPTDPGRARSLSDARLQLHYAAQFMTALGISYLEHEADDGHTNLGWDATLGALMSRAAMGTDGAVALGVGVRDLTLVATRRGTVTDVVALSGLTLEAALERVRAAIGSKGLDGARYTLERHYELPPHPVAAGAKFKIDNVGAFDELVGWFGNAAIALGRVACDVPGASEVRVWPHHFDMATLVSYDGGGSTGAGFGPGDTYYDEPYFYVNAYPSPRADRLTAELAGGGQWHTHEWIGAVLTGSQVTGDAAAQERQVRAFLDSALESCRELVGG